MLSGDEVELGANVSLSRRLAAVVAGSVITAGAMWALVGCASTATEAPPPVAAPVLVPTAIPEAPEQSDDENVSATEFALDENVVVWSEDGVTVHGPDGYIVKISDEPALHALLFADGSVAYQPSENRIEFSGPNDSSTIDATEGRELRLHDGEFRDGFPALLVTERVIAANPDEADERLLLINAVTTERTDLGSVGGWEVSTQSASFVSERVTLHQHDTAETKVVILDRSGNQEHEVWVGPDKNVTMLTSREGGSIEILEPQLTSQGPEVRVSDVVLGDDELSLRGVYPLELGELRIDGGFCGVAARASDRSLLCSQSAGPPIRIETDDSWRTELLTAATGTGTSGAAVDVAVPGVLRELGTSPDGRFTYYFVERRGSGRIVIDDGSGVRPAMYDSRDRYRMAASTYLDTLDTFRFIDDTTVIWNSSPTSTFTTHHIARIDDDGMMRDITGRDRYVDEEELWLLDFEPAAVMSSGRDLNIEIAKPLIGLIDEGPWSPLIDTEVSEPGWFVGDTLGPAASCGGKTLYRTTADGFSRVLPTSIELDRIVGVEGTETFDGPMIDSASIHRYLAIATACPGSYEGVQLHLATEGVGYGDGGPRSRPGVGLWNDRPIALEYGVTEYQAVTAITGALCGGDLGGSEIVVVDVVHLDGEAARYRVVPTYGFTTLSVSRLDLAPGVEDDLCVLADVAVVDPADIGPSQSPESAARDGVIPFLAELPLSERSDIVGLVEVQGQQWVATKFPAEIRNRLMEESFSSGRPFDPSSSELLLVEAGQVMKALLFPHMPLTGILGDDTHVIVYRSGDGGYPDSGFVRLNIESGEIERWLVPAPPIGSAGVDWNSASELWPDWQLPTEETALRFGDALAIAESDGRLGALTDAFDRATPR